MNEHIVKFRPKVTSFILPEYREDSFVLRGVATKEKLWHDADPNQLEIVDIANVPHFIADTVEFKYSDIYTGEFSSFCATFDHIIRTHDIFKETYNTKYSIDHQIRSFYYYGSYLIYFGAGIDQRQEVIIVPEYARDYFYSRYPSFVEVPYEEKIKLQRPKINFVGLKGIAPDIFQITIQDDKTADYQGYQVYIETTGGLLYNNRVNLDGTGTGAFVLNTEHTEFPIKIKLGVKNYTGISEFIINKDGSGTLIVRVI